LRDLFKLVLSKVSDLCLEKENTNFSINLEDEDITDPSLFDDIQKFIIDK
jgi:hypothetical protein